MFNMPRSMDQDSSIVDMHHSVNMLDPEENSTMLMNKSDLEDEDEASILQNPRGTALFRPQTIHQGQRNRDVIGVPSPLGNATNFQVAKDILIQNNPYMEYEDVETQDDQSSRIPAGTVAFSSGNQNNLTKQQMYATAQNHNKIGVGKVSESYNDNGGAVASIEDDSHGPADSNNVESRKMQRSRQTHLYGQAKNKGGRYKTQQTTQRATTSALQIRPRQQSNQQQSSLVASTNTLHLRHEIPRGVTAQQSLRMHHRGNHKTTIGQSTEIIKQRNGSDGLTFIKQRLEPSVRVQLQDVETRSQVSFQKIYQLEKDFKKGMKRFYQPRTRKKSAATDKVAYTQEFLRQLGIATVNDEKA